MLISPVQAFNVNSQNNSRNVKNTNQFPKTNSLMNDTVSFGTRTPRILPEDLRLSANEIIKKLKSERLKAHINQASTALSSPYVTEVEQLKALSIVQRGPIVQSAVEINGKSQTCTASLGQYSDGWALCLDTGNETGVTTRYRIGLKDHKEVTEASRIKVQKIDKDELPISYAALNDSKSYNKAASTIKTMLDALRKA